MVVLVAGCAGRTPAPIDHRDQTPPVGSLSSIPRLPPPSPIAAPSAATAAGAGAPVPMTPDGRTPVEPGTAAVQTAPIRGGIIESKPLPGPTVAVKASPRVAKRPYSDVALADLTRTDAANGGAVALPPAPPPTLPGAASPGSGSPGSGAAGAGGAPGAAAAGGALAGGASSGSTSANGAGPGTAAPPAVVATAPASRPGDSAAWMWPAKGKVIATFDNAKQKGILIAGKRGDAVTAAADGKVIFAGVVKGYGNLVVVKHANDLLSVYAHNDANNVKEQQNVKRGQTIATLGASDADRVALHFEVRRQGKPIDPLSMLPAP